MSGVIYPKLVNGLLLQHISMLIVVAYFLMNGQKNIAKKTIKISLLAMSYILFIYITNGLNERALPESIKVLLLVSFVVIMANNYNLAKYWIYAYGYIAVFFLGIYIIVSDDPMVYGGRLGIMLDEKDEEKMISANTIGFLCNIFIANLLSSKRNLEMCLLPLPLILIYLTYSRGAALGAIILIFYYIWIKNKLVGVVYLAIIFIFIYINLGVNDNIRLTDDTGSGRFLLYPMMIDKITNSFATILLGYGPGSVNFEIYPGKTLTSAHNGYIELMYTYGVMGVIMILKFFIMAIRKFESMQMTSKSYIILIGTYSLSEDLMGAHTLMVFGLLISLIVEDFQKKKYW